MVWRKGKIGVKEECGKWWNLGVLSCWRRECGKWWNLGVWSCLRRVFIWSIVCGVNVMLMREGIVCFGCVWFGGEVMVDACGEGADGGCGGSIKVKSGGAADNVGDGDGDVWG